MGKNEYFPTGSSDAISPAMKNFSFTLSAGSPPLQQPSKSTNSTFSLAQFGTSPAIGNVLLLC